MRDLAMEETSREVPSIQNLVLSEMTARSFEEGSYRNGYKRAKLYLTQLLGRKAKGPKGVPSDRRNAYQSSEDSLLNQALEFERKGKSDDAADLYRKYLARYPKNSNNGFVSLALANTLIQQNRLESAESLLHKIAEGYSKSEEKDLAGRFSRKIRFLKQRDAVISRVKTKLAAAKNQNDREILQLKAAMAHLSRQQAGPAEELLKAVLLSPDPKKRSQAKFYLGWAYKLRRHYGEAEKALLDLLDDAVLARDLELGLHAQLADIYYRQHDAPKALKQYLILRKKSKKSPKKSASEEAWYALSEIEAAGIYYFDGNDPAQAVQHLQGLEEMPGIYAADMEDLKKDLQQPTVAGDTRAQAFRAFEIGEFNRAYDLFTKNTGDHPEDAWTYAGLSMIYILWGNVNAAIENAEHAYRLNQNDLFTASALGYAYGLAGKHPEAAAVFRQAVRLDPANFPAKFNLSYNYLKIEEFEKAMEILAELDKSFGKGKITLNSAKISNNIGYALWRTGKREEAARKFREALEASPDFSVAKKNLSSTTGRIREAA